MTFLIIGGDAAGMSAASRARRLNPDLSITVLEQTRDVSYSACGMPYNIADPDRPIDDLVVREARVFRSRQGIDLLTGHRAEAIDRNRREVTATTPDGRSAVFPYDRLLIATGASPVRPDIPGMDLDGVMALKSLEDGRLLKAHLAEKPVNQAVIIGMGYIALEMCEALRGRGVSVVMVKPRPVFLPWMEPSMAAVVKEECRRHGVDVQAGRRILRIESVDGHLSVVCDGDAFDGDLVLAAAGIRPNSQLAAAAGLQLSVHDAIAVDSRLRTSDPNIFSAGDCADAFHLVTGKRTWIPLALRANRAGWAVADNVCGRDKRLHGIAGSAVFKVFDLQVARTGLTVEEAADNGFTPESVVIKSRSRAHAHPGASDIWVHMIGDRSSGRLLGVQMIGKEGVAHRIHAPSVALHAHMTVDQFSRADLGYAPPFGPTWDPMLTAANQLLKRM
jgi:NADPH-dependent 2,4-dienoyl-CoA reductase/sulfur reductase-like enzyme